VRNLSMLGPFFRRFQLLASGVSVIARALSHRGRLAIQ
jgi:hypothetical protein